MKDSVRITVPSHPKYLSFIRECTVKYCDISDIFETFREEIKLAVDEACANVIKHAYKGDTTKTFYIEYKVTKKGLQVIIEDNGAKAHIDSLKGRRLDDLRPGGLGIHFIKKVFDVFKLDERKRKGNRLILLKYF